jgi:nicotinamidase-related amidase
MRPKTLLEMAGATATPPDLANCTVVVIDAQREYVDGALPLSGVKEALTEIAKLLDRARHLGAPVTHIKHRGKAGGAFDPDATRGQIAEEVSPAAGETVIEKTLPNSFAGTDLKAHLDTLGRKQLVLAGFMTHMCVEATARSALDHGFQVAVLAAGTARRDLPDPLSDATIKAAEVQRNALTALSDRFATIVRDVTALKS